MTVLLIGYARVSTDGQDLTAQCDGLQARGVHPTRIYVDHGLIGTDRRRGRLRALSGSGDVVARIGGDEFVILRPGTDRAPLNALRARVCTDLDRQVDGPVGKLDTGASVGMAIGRAGTDPDDLMRTADDRTYRAKSARRAQRP